MTPQRVEAVQGEGCGFGEVPRRSELLHIPTTRETTLSDNEIVLRVRHRPESASCRRQNRVTHEAVPCGTPPKANLGPRFCRDSGCPPEGRAALAHVSEACSHFYLVAPPSTHSVCAFPTAGQTSAPWYLNRRRGTSSRGRGWWHCRWCNRRGEARARHQTFG